MSKEENIYSELQNQLKFDNIIASRKIMLSSVLIEYTQFVLLKKIHRLVNKMNKNWDGEEKHMKA